MSSSWSPECLRRSIDEVRALSSMYGDGSSLEEDPTEVVHHESLLDEVESLLDHGHAHVRSVPALEVTVRLLGARLRGGGVDVAVRLPPGYPASCRAEVQVQGNARVTVDDLRKTTSPCLPCKCARFETASVRANMGRGRDRETGDMRIMSARGKSA